MSRSTRNYAWVMSILCFFAFTANAADGGYDVEFYDAGTILLEPMACMPPADVQRLDVDFRASEADARGYRTAAVAATTAAAVVTLVCAALAVGLASKR